MRKSLLTTLVAVCLLLWSCDYSEGYDGEDTRSAFVELTITMPLSNVNNAPDGYESGSIYENTISNYRIYFYDYETNTFLMELRNPSLVRSSSDRTNAKYTITAELTEESGNSAIKNIRDFKLVMLANWETYEEPNVGATLADLCNGQYATYTALATKDMDLATSGKSLPFYGVHAYTGVTFIETGTTYLRESITLLRAVAKVEVIIDNDNDNEDHISLASATLHRYNSKGYCAPANVYSESDYGQAEDWENDYTGTAMHLVGEQNDSDDKSLSLLKVQDRERDASGAITQKETWLAYIPEYDNSGEDYSYISIVYDHQMEGDEDDEEYKIYFAVYDSDGTTKAYDTNASEEDVALRRDIHRNNLYRFNVKYIDSALRVFVDRWEYVFDNDWTFGDLAAIIYSGTEGQFEVDGVYYESLVVLDESGKVDEDNLTCSIIKVSTSTTGYFAIPETVTYLTYTYTVTTIGYNCFDADTEITSISIPATVTTIESRAFHYDLDLESIILHSSTPPTCAEDAFEDDDISSITLLIPEGSKDAYAAADVWGQFENVVEVNYGN